MAGIPAVPIRRVVLLGASNLTRGIATVVETTQAIWGQPLEILVAAGFGRSYGIDSRVLGRSLPGIMSCGLWDKLPEQQESSTAALITDIGNDLLYGVEPPQIISWIEAAIDRLQQTGARIVVTLLPMVSVSNLSVWRFHLFRRLLFPSCRLGYDELRRRAAQLHDAVEQLGRTRHVRLVQQSGHWYGFDPIHIRRRHWAAAWGQILSSWQPADDPLPQARGSLRQSLYLRTRAPHRRSLFGFDCRQSQPSARLGDGTSISFY